MADDTERLVVALEARIRDFERNFQKANATAAKNFAEIEKRGAASAKRLEDIFAKSALGVASSMKTMMLGFAGGLAGGVLAGGLEGIVSRLGNVAKSVAEIGDQAKRAGLSTKAFQELAYVAEQNRIPVDALTDGMKELSLRADEWVQTGGGSAAEAFQRLGFTATELKNRLKDPSALLVEIVKRMEGLNRAARIRIADEIFGGTGGERFVELIDQGADGIKRTIAEANNLGIVMDDKLINRAAEIDRAFNKIAQTVSTNLKGAIVEVVDAWADFFDEFRDAENQSSDNVAQRLAEVVKERNDAERELRDLMEEGKSGNPRAGLGMEIEGAAADVKRLAEEEIRLRSILAERAEATRGAGKAAADTKPAVDGLADSLAKTGTAATAGTSGIQTFADAIRSLKNEIPELAAGLAELDARSRIDAAYNAAVSKAQTMGQVYEANRLRDAALAALAGKPAREAARGGMLDLIGFAEGTDKGRGYNETLGYGKFTGGNRNLVVMTLDQIDALQGQMLADPSNTFNSSALGRYQITRRTLRGLRDKLGLRGDDLFDPAMQDRLAEELLRQRGNNPAALRNEWEGLRRVDDQTIRTAYDGTSGKLGNMDPGLKEQAASYDAIIASARQFVAEQGNEQAALGMTKTQAAALRHEQEMLTQAQQANVNLTPQQRAEIAQLAQAMAQAETATQRAADAQGQMKEAGRFFGEQITSAFSSIVTGASSVEDALGRIANAIADAVIQAALLGSGPLGGLFGGGLLSAIFGFSGGGEVKAATGGLVRGPGTGTSDSIPARLSDGEFVVNARATARHRRLLETINAGDLPIALASGGLVGRVPAVPSLPRPAVQPIAQGGTTINTPINITVEGGSRGKEADTELAKLIARQANDAVQSAISGQLQNQMRPGGLLNPSMGRM